MAGLKLLNLVLRFLLELCVLAALSYWGYQFGKGRISKFVLGAGIPLLTAFIWATFGAPGSSLELPVPTRFILEFVIFGMAAAAIFASGQANLALTFVLIVVINRVLMFFWNQ
jgi:hypothetical protein